MDVIGPLNLLDELADVFVEKPGVRDEGMHEIQVTQIRNKGYDCATPVTSESNPCTDHISLKTYFYKILVMTPLYRNDVSCS